MRYDNVYSPLANSSTTQYYYANTPNRSSYSTVKTDSRYSNLGFTCYMNAALQLLRPCFLQLFGREMQKDANYYPESDIGVLLYELYISKTLDTSAAVFAKYFSEKSQIEYKDVLRPGNSMDIIKFIFTQFSIEGKDKSLQSSFYDSFQGGSVCSCGKPIPKPNYCLCFAEKTDQYNNSIDKAVNYCIDKKGFCKSCKKPISNIGYTLPEFLIVDLGVYLGDEFFEMKQNFAVYNQPGVMLELQSIIYQTNIFETEYKLAHATCLAKHPSGVWKKYNDLQETTLHPQHDVCNYSWNGYPTIAIYKKTCNPMTNSSKTSSVVSSHDVGSATQMDANPPHSNAPQQASNAYHMTQYVNQQGHHQQPRQYSDVVSNRPDTLKPSQQSLQPVQQDEKLIFELYHKYNPNQGPIWLYSLHSIISADNIHSKPSKIVDAVNQYNEVVKKVVENINILMETLGCSIVQRMANQEQHQVQKWITLPRPFTGVEYLAVHKNLLYKKVFEKVMELGVTGKVCVDDSGKGDLLSLKFKSFQDLKFYGISDAYGFRLFEGARLVAKK